MMRVLVLLTIILTKGYGTTQITPSHEGVKYEKARSILLAKKEACKSHSPYGYLKVEKTEAITGSVKYREGSGKADTDTLHYDSDPAYSVEPSYYYYFCDFDLDSAKLMDSTWVLTSGLIYLYPFNQVVSCTLYVYEMNGTLRAKKGFLGQEGWNDVILDEPVYLHDDFYLMFYIPVSPSREVTVDDGSDPDTMSGVYDGDWWYFVDHDLNIRACGHYEKVHDASASALSFVSYPYTVHETDTVIYHFSNYGNYEENIPVTYIFGNDTVRDTLFVGIHEEETTQVEFTIHEEGIVGMKSWTTLLYDTVPSNDTFPDYTMYIFPTYTDWAEGFEFISSFPPSGWVTIDGDGDGYTWSWYVGDDYSHTGWYFTASRYNSSGNDDWLITPAIPVLYENNTSFGLFARAISISYPESLEVWVLGSQNPADTLELLFASSIDDTVYSRLSFGLDKYRGDTIYIGIRNAGVDRFYLMVDDIFLRRVQLPEDCIAMEVFEEGMIPPGWSSTGSDFLFGTPEEAGVDSIAGNLAYYDTKGATPGSSSSITTPVYKVLSDTICYQFYYNNIDGSDYLTVYYSLDDGATWIKDTTLYTTTGWDTVYSSPIILTAKASYISFKLEGTGDGGTSNIAVDEFKVFASPSPTPVEEEISSSADLDDITMRTLNTGKLVVYAQKVNTPVAVSIYDVIGRKLKSEIVKTPGIFEFTLSHEGLYFVQISGGGKTKIEKVLYIR